MVQVDPLENLAREMSGRDDPLSLVPEDDGGAAADRVFSQIVGDRFPFGEEVGPLLTLDQAHFMLQVAQGFQPTDVDRSVLGEVGIGLVRGTISLQQSGAALLEAGATQIERRVGESPITRLLRRFGAQGVAGAALVKSQIPRSTESRAFSLRKTIGNVAEATPQFALAVGIGALAPPAAPFLRIAMFAGTVAGPTAGQQYIESLEATGDPDKAAIEAGAAGLIVFGLESIPGFFLFKRTKVGQKLLADAAMRVSARMGGAAIGESLEELGEAVLIEAVESWVRTGDLEAFTKAVSDDPEFWTETFNAMIAGFVLGGGAGATIAGIEVNQRLRVLSEVAEVDGSTIQEAHELLVLAEQLRTQQEQPKPEEAPEVPPAAPEEPAIEVPEEPVAAVPPTEEPPTAPPEPAAAAPVPVEVAPTPTPAQVQQREADEAIKRPPLRERVRKIIDDLVGVVADVPAERTIAEQEILDELGRLRVDSTAVGRISSEMRESLVRLIRSSFKGKVPKPLLTEVARVKTLSQFSNALGAVRQAVVTQRKGDAIERLQKVVGQIEPEKLSSDLREAFDALTEGIRFGELAPKTTQRLERFRNLIARQPDVGLSQSIRKEIAELDKIPVQQLSADEVTAVADALASILTLQRQRSKALERLRLQEEQTTADTIAREITNAVPNRGRFFRGRILRTPVFRSTIGGLFRNVVGVVENADLDFMGELLGGSEASMTFEVLHQDLDDSQSDGLEFYHQEVDALGDFLQGEGLDLGSEELADLSADLAGRRTTLGKTLSAVGVRAVGRIPATVHEIELKSGETLEVTSAERMGLLMMLADDETFDMVVFKGVPVRFRNEPTGKSRRLRLSDVRAIANSMPAAELSIVRFMVQRMNTTMKERMRAHSISRRGFDITKPDTWTPRFRRQETTPSPTTLDSLDTRINANVGLEPSIVKRRGQDAKSPLEVRDAFTVYNNVAWATGMYTAQEPALTRARKMLKTTQVRKALEASKVPRAADGINEILNAVAREITGEPSDRGLAERAFAPAARNLPVGILGLKPRIGLYQGVSVLVAQAELPIGYIKQARSAVFDRATDERMLEVHYLRQRFEMTALGLINDATDFAQNILGFKEAGEGPMIFIRIVDRAAIRVLFRAVELEVADMVAEGRIDEAQATVVRDRKIRRVVTRTQPVFDAVHNPVRAVEARRKVLLKLANMFRAMRNRLVIMNMRSGLRIARAPTRAVVRREAVNLGVTNLANALAIVSIRNVVKISAAGILLRAALGTLTADDEDELKKFPKKLAADLIRTLGSVPFLGEWIAEGLVRVLLPSQRGFELEVSPIEGIANDGINAWGKMRRGANEADLRKMLEGVAELGAATGALEGIPAPAVVDTVIGLLDELDKEDATSQGSGR